MLILYAHTSPINNVRITKNVKKLIINHKVIYVGSERNAVKSINLSFLDEINSGKLVYILKKKKILNGISGLLGFIQYVLLLNHHIKKNKPDLIILTNEELVFCLKIINPFLKTKIILDAIDALDIRTSSKFIKKYILCKIVNFARNKSNLIIEVEEFRKKLRPEFNNKTIVIRNTPSKIDFLKKNKQEEKYIYASGSLNKDINGIEILLKACNNFKFKIIIAGFITDKGLLQLIESHNNCQYIGQVSYEDSLNYAFYSSAIFAYYSPVIENFKFAAPNKVYEAFMLGKPLIINSECVISSFCKQNNFGYLNNYYDSKSLEDTLQNIFSKDFNFNETKVKNKFNSEYDWNIESKKWDIVTI